MRSKRISEILGGAEKTAVQGAQDIVLADLRGERWFGLTVRSGAVQVEVRIERHQELVLATLTQTAKLCSREEDCFGAAFWLQCTSTAGPHAW